MCHCGMLLAMWVFAAGSLAMANDTEPTVSRVIHPRWAPRSIVLRDDDVTPIMGYRAQLTGHLSHQPMPDPDVLSSKCTVFGFVDAADAMVFRVEAPCDGAYTIAVLCNARRELLEGLTLEVVHDGTSLTAQPPHAQTPQGSSRLTYERVRMPGLLKLHQGANEIVVRLRERSDAQAKLAAKELSRRIHAMRDGSFRVWSIELARPEALEQIRRRAESLRASTQWMIDGKYGLFTHWSPLCYPLHGDVQTKDCYQEAVEAFDVDAYVNMVEETGAAWVVFTTTHGPHYWPGPCKTIDRILPGRTCRRDLIGELADALGRKGIRLMLYYHTGYGDKPWAEASGMYKEDLGEYFDNLAALFEEVSKRYGRRLASSAVYIDTSPRTLYQLDCPYERITRAIKSGNPDAIVGYSTDYLPMLTAFADIPSQDGYDWADAPLPEEWFGPGCAYDELQRSRFLFMDDWIPRKPLNGVFPPPHHAPEQYVHFIEKMAEQKAPVTINLLITQDVKRGQPFVNPECLAIMRQVRRAIRGE
ncbi:alpha-L-fucosidase [Planctomycetota bacterium]